MFSPTDISEIHINQITQLIRQHKGDKNLKALDLSSNRITDEGFISLCKSVCDSNIQSFNVADNKLAEKCAEAVVHALKTSKCLKVLDLSGNHVFDA